MIWSRYNHMFVSKKNKFLLYNSVTNSFIEVNAKDYESIKHIRSVLSTSRPISGNKRLVNELINARFIVENDQDSVNKLMLDSYSQRFNRDSINFTIAPTLHCNFNCPYCYEENRKSVYMSDETELRLVEYILSFPDIKSINITWYGGEPLLAFKRIKSITERIRNSKKSCFSYTHRAAEQLKSQGITDEILHPLRMLEKKIFQNEYSFWEAVINVVGSKLFIQNYLAIKDACSLPFPVSASMATNGYLLTEDKIDDLIALNVRKIQITLDGNENTHNKRRTAISGNSFQVILTNVENLFKRTNRIQIAFRINIDKTNENEFTEIHNYLSNRFNGKNMFIYPGYIYSTYRNTEGCASVESCQMKREERAEFLLSKFPEIKNHKNNLYYPTNIHQECMARRINSYLIDAHGDIYKCWDDIGIIERRIANLNEKGKDKINIKLLNKYLVENDPYSNSNCLECFYLPICGGGCPYQRIHNKGIVDTCVVSKDRINEFLETHYEIKKMNERELPVNK